MMQITTRRIGATLAFSVVACSVGLAGCTAKDAANAPTATPTAPISTKLPSPLPADPTFEGSAAGAAADVKITECPTGEGKQVAKATVTNSAKEARDYAVMVIWLKNGSGTPLGSGLEVVKNLGPGEKKDIQVTGEVVAKADVCTLNVHAGKLKG